MKKRVTIERSYRAHVDDVWDLWTTKEGIESWWGPDGFAVTVKRIDLRPGGKLEYVMAAKAPEMVAFMQANGMPVATPHSATFTEVTPKKRLAYDHVVDFIPGEKPYDVSHLVEIVEERERVRVVLTFDAMHSDEWTQRALAGWEQELGKLGGALAREGA